MDHPDYKPTNASLCKQMNISFIRLMKLIDTFDNYEATQVKDKSGWTVCDHLIHLSVWTEGLAALLRRENRWLAMNLNPTQVENQDLDFINDIIFKQNQTCSFKTALLSLLIAHDNVLAALEKLSDEDMLLPYDRFIHPFTGDEGLPISSYILSNTSDHYCEHMRWIKAIVESKQVAARGIG